MTQDKAKSVNTTGHVWDENLQELTNPLPMWWVWTFYITIVFSIIYWIMYPAWPIGHDYTKGVGNTITYTAKKVDGSEEQKTTHWNMRSKLMAEMNAHNAEQKQWFDKVAAAPYDAVSKDAELMQFVNSAGATLFKDNCAPCHQAGGVGKITFSPNLTDDIWMYGGTYDNINTTLMNGRNGIMPAFKGVLPDEKIVQVANYVLSLSGEPHDAAAAEAGKAVFETEGGCAVCHGPDAKGIQAMGSANLTDKSWLWANVPAHDDAAGKVAEVQKIVSEGMSRGKMPAWAGRLKPEQLKVLTLYVHDTLGGGQ